MRVREPCSAALGAARVSAVWVELAGRRWARGGEQTDGRSGSRRGSVAALFAFRSFARVAGAICNCSRGARLAAAVESLLRVARGSARVVAGQWSRCNSSSLVWQGETED